MQFVKTIRPVKLPSGSSAALSGTQNIDVTWGSLDSYIPKQVKTKLRHQVNPLLEKYIFSWLYRVNHKNVDGFAQLGADMKCA